MPGIGIGIAPHEILQTYPLAGDAPWSPVDLPGLLLWHDFSDITTLFQDVARTVPVALDGDPIGGVTDLSGNGNHASQITAAKRPVYKTGVQNGLSVARFDWVDDYLDSFDMSGLGIASAEGLIVVKVDADPPVGVGIGLWTFTPAGANQYYPLTDGVIYETFCRAARYTDGNPVTTLAQFNLYSVYSAAAEYTGRLNNAVIYTTAGNFALGAVTYIGRGTGTYLDGDIGEICIYGPGLSAANRLDFYNYTVNKWNTP